MRSTRNRYGILILVIVLMVLTTFSRVYAQQDTIDSKPNLSWLNLGIGGSSVGISAGASFSYSFGNSLISIRSVAATEFHLFGPSPSETAWDLGLLYGRCAKASYGLASISAGVAIVGGVRRGGYVGSTGTFITSQQYETREFSTMGVSIEGQLFWTPSTSFAIGLYGFGNANSEHSFAGVLLCLQFGA